MALTICGLRKDGSRRGKGVGKSDPLWKQVGGLTERVTATSPREQPSCLFSGYNFIYVEIIRRGQSPQLVERTKCTRIAIYPLFDIFITEGCLLIPGSFVAKVLI